MNPVRIKSNQQFGIELHVEGGNKLSEAEGTDILGCNESECMSSVISNIVEADTVHAVEGNIGRSAKEIYDNSTGV